MSMTTVAATAALLACAPSAGAASSWTTPQSFAAGKNIDIVPRVGIAADGTSAAAWKTRKGGLVVSSRRPRGRFGPARVIDRKGARDWSVAAAPDGAFLVAWWDADGLRVAARTATRRPVVVRRVVATTSSAINGLQGGS
jgi:hypothetical protein